MKKIKHEEKISKEERKNNIMFTLKNEKKKKMILKIISIIVVIFIILGCCMLFKNQNQKQNYGYDLYGESDNFVYYDSSFIRINNTYYLNHGFLEIKNEKIEGITDIRLMCNDRLIIGSSQVLKGTSHEIKGYNELFPNEVVNNIDDWRYEITYTIKGESNTEILPIKNRKWDTNQKVNPI